MGRKIRDSNPRGKGILSRTVLITGATGFVGRAVLAELLTKGVNIREIKRGHRKNGETALSQDTRHQVIHTPDLFAENVNWATKVCSNVDIIVHLAWYVEHGKYQESPKNLDCLIGSLTLAKGALEAGISRFVGIGTCAEYDLTQSPLTVDSPLKPQSPYSAAKCATYLALSQIFKSSGTEFSWCRLFYVYGQGEDHRRLVPTLRSNLAAGKQTILKHGDSVVDFINVKDAAVQITDVVLGQAHGSFNVSSGAPITIKNFALTIADEYGHPDLIR